MIRRLHQLSFSAKLLTAFVLIIGLTTLAGYFFMSLSVNRAFSEFSVGRNAQQDHSTFNLFRLLYEEGGDMNTLLESLVAEAVDLPAVIVNPDGNVVFSPDLRTVQVDRHLDRDLLENGIAFSETPGGPQWIFLPIRYLAGLELENSYLSQSRRSMLLAGLIAGIAAMFLSFFLIRQLTGPLRKLDRASRQVAAGNFDERVDIVSSDEIGRLAGSFNDMAASLETSEQVKRRLIADISHELRTPITAVRTTLESLRDGLMEPTQATLSALHDKILLTTRLVQDLHQLALADSGRLSMHPRKCSVENIVDTILETIGVQMEDENITLIREIEPELPSIMADAQRIEQVLLNLLANAIRHTPPEGSILVQAEHIGRNVHVSINDSGSGLSDVDLQHVFDRFYRADEARTSDDTGAGLGLSIAKALIEAHGGRIWAENTPGSGACFAFTLPVFGKH
ncbi:HAMP domain-containing protein [Candidatus Bipolaricaulota bacterium]|nr:HAMP domain-containing protein [Candidatus Bipolaricaulota bacterium]